MVSLYQSEPVSLMFLLNGPHYKPDLGAFFWNFGVDARYYWNILRTKIYFESKVSVLGFKWHFGCQIAEVLVNYWLPNDIIWELLPPAAWWWRDRTCFIFLQSPEPPTDEGSVGWPKWRSCRDRVRVASRWTRFFIFNQQLLLFSLLLYSLLPKDFVILTE
jgi:hypothetical protein